MSTDMSSDTFADFRSNFPGTSEGVFTNVAQRGLMPVQVQDAITVYLGRRTGLGWRKEESFDLVEGTRVPQERVRRDEPHRLGNRVERGR